MTPTWVVETDNKEGFVPMILPQESVLEKELTKTKSIMAKGKEIPSNKNIAEQGKSQG